MKSCRFTPGLLSLVTARRDNVAKAVQTCLGMPRQDILFASSVQMSCLDLMSSLNKSRQNISKSCLNLLRQAILSCLWELQWKGGLLLGSCLSFLVTKLESIWTNLRVANLIHRNTFFYNTHSIATWNQNDVHGGQGRNKFNSLGKRGVGLGRFLHVELIWKCCSIRSQPFLPLINM